MTSSTKKVEQNLRKNIRKYRKMLGFTQLQLSIKAEVSKDFIYDLEAGRRNPSLDVLCKLADALKVEPYELLK